MLLTKVLGKPHVNRIQWLYRRTKVTVTKVEPSPEATIKRPTPILLVRVVLNGIDAKPWARCWQSRMSQLGYSSVDAAIDVESTDHSLSKYYEELSQVTAELSFFPPLMISHGMLAWRISQKYVSNKPLSGLVMIGNEEQDATVDLSVYPDDTFEPHFPIYMISRQAPPEFLEGWIDYDLPKNESDQVIAWMNDIGM
ncbi:hypothetical protein A0J61_02917 [Choanephora cucurbitarum]|uniref:Uncharacterized protein n=1 Tax=Choanephora cucurbitarum TaxID=101091 RepID=A0A1C7NJ21_9FUNG|nr:hypothetical protein A0J61_02917 [Choanephora cucurbitarum]